MQPDDAARPSLHRAFHRMACVFAALVCGIWLVLLTTLMVVDPERPEVGSVLVVLLVSAPVAYAIPYAVVRLVGVVVMAVRRRQGQATAPPDRRGADRS